MSTTPKRSLPEYLPSKGPTCRILRLPPGPRVQTGYQMKQAIDDYIRQHGEKSFRQWIKGQLVKSPVRSLADGDRKRATIELLR